MSTHGLRTAWIAIGIGAVLLAPGPSPARQAAASPVATTPRFAFYSDFATNLNDALVAAGVDRDFDRPALFETGDERSCFDDLPPSVRAGWNLAVGYYAEIVSAADWNDRRQYLIRMHLAGFDEQLEDARARRYVELVQNVRAAAAPAYEACRWLAQDAANRHWIDGVISSLNAHGEAIAARLEQHYRKPWPEAPARVDVVETVNWSGANSVFPGPGSSHLLISSSSEVDEALETVFHEASHGFMLRGDPLPEALGTAATELDVPVPDDLWHVILFYTTGETVRRVLDEAGEPGYEPMLYEIFERSDWVRYRGAIENLWPAYLDGDRELSEVMIDLVRAAG